MKIYILIAIFSLFAVSGHCQVVAIQNNEYSRLMLCIGNRLTVAVEGLSSGSVSLSTNNGSISKDKYRGAEHYIYHANTSGPAMIYVKKRNHKGSETIIDSNMFFVHRLPLSKPRFAGISGGELRQAIILAQFGIFVPIECCDFDARFMINSFSVLAYRNGMGIFRRDIEGDRIDKITSDFFYSLKNDDRLKFDNIKIKDCDGELRLADPIEITVTDASEYQKVRSVDTTLVEDPLTGETRQWITDSTWIRKTK
jgi:hypothetical protein